jgi:hypothetical protein
VNLNAIKAGKGNTERAACQRLHKLAARVPAEHAIVELGAYKGRTTAWLAHGASKGRGAPVYAVDPWDLRSADDWPDDYADHLAFDTYGLSETFGAYRTHLEATGVEVSTIRSFAEDAGLRWTGGQVGLLYHDAEHTAEAVERDLTAWMAHLAPSCVVALHDAGNPRFGVTEGARMLEAFGFDWPGRELHRWKKHPERRGLLVVRR